MAIKPKLIHLKQKGRIFGNVNFGNWLNYRKEPLANRLLCFVMKGLSSFYEIPVAYFLVRCLTGQQLIILIKKIVAELENIGFKVVRLVADDLSVNQKVFRELSGGAEIKPQIEHFVKPSRPLFLSFDYCHVFKNIRNNFLNRDLELRQTAPANSRKKSTPYLTKATDVALRITTESTILCIRSENAQEGLIVKHYLKLTLLQIFDTSRVSICFEPEFI